MCWRWESHDLSTTSCHPTSARGCKKFQKITGMLLILCEFRATAVAFVAEALFILQLWQMTSRFWSKVSMIIYDNFCCLKFISCDVKNFFTISSSIKSELKTLVSRLFSIFSALPSILSWTRWETQKTSRKKSWRKSWKVFIRSRETWWGANSI